MGISQKWNKKMFDRDFKATNPNHKKIKNVFKKLAQKTREWQKLH